MALKFDTNASLQRFRSVAASEESLQESIEELSAATEALMEAQADGAEICQVFDNLSIACESLKNGGLTASLLGVFNSEGELSKCVGQENLTVAGLEALGDRQVKTLTAKYIEGVEGKMAEYWAKFVQFLKNLWAKIVNWFKSLFTARAKYIKAVEGITSWKAENFKGDAMVACAGQNELKTIESTHEAIVSAISSAAQSVLPDNHGVRESKGWENQKKSIDEFCSKSRTEAKLSSLFSFQTLVKHVTWYIDAARSTKMQEASKRITAGMDHLVKEAGAAANIEGGAGDSKRQAIKDKYDGYRQVLEMIRYENKLVLKIGAQLAKAVKVGYKAPDAK